MPLAPPAYLDAPSRRPWPGGLVEVARATGRLVTHDDDRFVAGATLAPLSCEGVTLVDPCGAVTERQTVALPGGTTAGTFTLAYTPLVGPAQTTAPIAFNATAAAVCAALSALPAIGAGNVTCNGGPLPTAAVTVDFTGVTVTGNQAELTGDGAALVPPGAVTVVTTRQGSFATPKPTGTNRPALVDLTTYLAVGRDSCTTYGWPMADYQGRAREHLEASRSRAVEFELWTGALTSNPSFNGGGAVTVGTGQSRALGLALLVQAIAEGVGGEGVVHARPKLVELWGAARLVERDDRGVLVTTTGTPVVAGSGYPGTGPADQAPTATSEWAFATDAIAVHEGAVVVYPDSMGDATNHMTNVVEFRAEQPMLALWGGCTLAAVEINPNTS